MNEGTVKWLVIGGVVLVVIAKLSKAFGNSLPGGTSVPAAPDPVGAGGAPQQATLTQAEATSICDAIESAIWGGFIASPTEDEEEVIAQLSKLGNDADVRLVMNVYGKRGTALDKYTLAQTIGEYLDRDDINEINSIFATRGIKFRF